MSDNYCPMRSWELSVGEIKFPEEHNKCGRKKCWTMANKKVFRQDGEPYVKLLRLKEQKETVQDKPCRKRGGGSYYCPFRAWSLSRDWISDPADHIFCGKTTCWRKFNKGMFKGKELKVIIPRVDMPGGMPSQKRSNLDEWMADTYAMCESGDCDCPLENLSPKEVVCYRTEKGSHPPKVTYLITKFEEISDPLIVKYERMKRAYPDFVKEFDMDVADDSYGSD